MPKTKVRGYKVNNRATKIRQGHPSMSPMKVIRGKGRKVTMKKKYV